MKFKIGDKVRRCAPNTNYDTRIVQQGNIYTVKEYINSITIKLIEDEENQYSTAYFELVDSTSDFIDNDTLLFQVGDIVEAFGVRGEVSSTSKYGRIFIKFNNGVVDSFTTCGKGVEWHQTPSLKLIERPVKEVKFETIIKCSFDNGVRIEHSDLSKLPHGKKVEVTVKIKE